MRVLFVRNTPLGDPGAPATHYVPRTVAELGHSVTLVARSPEKTDRFWEGSLEVLAVGKDTSWLAQLRSEIRNSNPQVVHVYIHHGCGMYPLLFRRPGGPRFVLDIRSPLMSRGMERRLRQWKNWLESLGYSAVSVHGLESGRTVVGPWRTLHWVPSGVDFAAVPPVPPGGWEDAHAPLRLVYIGSLDRKRGVREMIRAVALAARALPLTLDLYGYGPDRDQLERDAAEQAPPSTVRFLNPLPREELFRRLGSYDVGLAYVPRFPYDPAPPIKTQEYLACGLPVLATDTTGNRIFVTNRENGLLAPEDPDSYARGITAFTREISYPGAREKARLSMLPFEWRTVVRERLIPLYEELAGGTPVRPDAAGDPAPR